MYADRIIDIDSQLFVAGWYANKIRGGAKAAIEKLADRLDFIRQMTPANGEYLLLKGVNKKTQFRYEIYPEYKANRAPGEAHFNDEQRHWLLDTQRAIDISELYPELETDDTVGMYHKNRMDVIVSIDKDLRQYPGAHFNPDKNETEIITPLDGAWNFWIQVLAGDHTDNVKGIQDMGPAGAKKVLEGAKTYQAMEKQAMGAYAEFAGKEKALKVMKREAMLVWMSRPWAMRWKRGLGAEWFKQYECLT